MKATIVVDDPIVVPIAQMQLMPDGIMEMARWVQATRPQCVPEQGFGGILDLLPHDGLDKDPSYEIPAGGVPKMRRVSENELLCEFAGRKCFDAETEVLTRTGWVPFPALPRGVPVATFNASTGHLEFEMPTDYVQKTHIGRMYCVESRAFSIRVTDDHDMWVQPRKGMPWQFKPAASLLGQQYSMRRAAPLRPDESEPVDVAWAAFVGHYLAEGSLVDGSKYGCGSRVVLYQRPETAGAIMATLATLGIEPYIKTDPRNGVLHIVVNSTDIATRLADLGTHSYNKHVPRDAFSWPLPAREALLDALMAGDGTVIKGARVYTTTSKQLADDVQLLILLTGRPGSISSVEPSDGSGSSFKGNHRVYRVREGRHVVGTVNGHGSAHDLLMEDAAEVVYCVSVPNRVLLLRRRDKTFMASNCYDSFADAGAKRTNGEYLRSMWQGRIPHRSTGYHAKMSFFIAHVSRRVSHELIRNYVGSDRDEEGSPSQESTRFTHHPGTYVAHPSVLLDPDCLRQFRYRAERNYEEYVATIGRAIERHRHAFGHEPRGLDRKRIYEAAAGDLLMSCGTSFIWTTNPMALTKLFHERDHEQADMEMIRLARAWKRVCLERWPNLFPDFHPSR